MKTKKLDKTKSEPEERGYERLLQTVRNKKEELWNTRLNTERENKAQQQWDLPQNAIEEENKQCLPMKEDRGIKPWVTERRI